LQLSNNLWEFQGADKRPVHFAHSLEMINNDSGIWVGLLNEYSIMTILITNDDAKAIIKALQEYIDKDKVDFIFSVPKPEKNI
jgi:hypothetical protein